MTEQPFHIAVLGAGPKALYALEELLGLLNGTTGAVSRPEPRRLAVTIIDAVAVPGTGAAYDPDQSHLLRLNVTAAILDAPATGTFPAFADWVSGPYPQLVGEPYPPRAVIGEYLAERWQRTTEGLTRHADVEHVRARVTDVRGEDDGWHLVIDADHSVDTESPSNRGTDAPRGVSPLVGPVDEVLIATGHAAGHDGALVHPWRSPLPLIPAVLPAEQMLTAERVPPGSRVAVRGGALTFIDACLMLTKGRGGTFIPDDDSPASAPAPARLVHARGPREPAVIRPITRQGLLLDAKPDPGTPLSAAGERAAEQARARFAAGAHVGPDEVLEIVVDAATAMLSGSTDRTRDDRAADVRAAVLHTLRTSAEPDLPRGPGRAEAALRRSVEIAQGSRSPGPAWALGRMWQTLYSQVSGSLRGSDASEDEWARFRDAAQVLERFAFGPPLINARKLLAMIESGAVDLSWMDGGVRVDANGIHGASTEVDVVIDAVLTPPGLLNLTDELASSLLQRGLVQVRPGRRGAMIDEAGSPVGLDDAPLVAADGRPVTGLALIGRPTEDHVIGHDSLNRHLHHEGRHWAQRIAGRVDTVAAVATDPDDATAPVIVTDREDLP